MTIMNSHQKKLVEDHLYLVKNIILSSMNINESVQGLGYDDLYQTGCEALCNATLHYREDRGTAFATFADTVIKNQLISHCRKAARNQKSILYLEEPMSNDEELTFADTLPCKTDHALSDLETMSLLSDAAKRYSGISQKGMEALALKCMGHTGVEIAGYYGVKPNHIAAWISRAIKKLRNDSCFSRLQH